MESFFGLRKFYKLATERTRLRREQPFEGLAQLQVRELFSLALDNAPYVPTGPAIYIDGGLPPPASTRYDATTHSLVINTYAYEFVANMATGPSYAVTPAAYNVTIQVMVGNDGKLMPDGSTTDLMITGTTGDGAYNGTLLSGTATDFGFAQSAESYANEAVDFRFTPTGGALAGLFSGEDIGVNLVLQNGTFAGGFGGGFTGGSQGMLGAITAAATLGGSAAGAGATTGGGVSPSSQSEVFVQHLFSDTLGRAPTGGELAMYAGEIDAKTATSEQVASTIINSTEYRTIVIQNLYQTILGRSADASGVNYWLNYFAQGNTVEQMKAGFYGSNEYVAAHGGTDEGAINAYYEAFLGRDADTGGMNYWKGKVAGGETLTQAARGIETLSTEGASDIATQAYETYLGRSPDTSGLAYWTKQIQAGKSQLDMEIGFLGSAEYFSRA